MGSQTVGATIITQMTMGPFNLIAVFLLLVWSLSPIGSQASLQAVTPIPQAFNSISPETYFDDRTTPGFSANEYGKSVSLDALFMSSLMSTSMAYTPDAGSDADSFDNVLIPDYSRLGNFLSLNESGWYNTSWPFIANSSSALGMPIVLELYTGTNATFTLESSFLALDCSNNTLDHNGGYPFVPLNDHSLFQAAENGTLSNETFYGYQSNGTFSISTNGFYHQILQNI